MNDDLLWLLMNLGLLLICIWRDKPVFKLNSPSIWYRNNKLNFILFFLFKAISWISSLKYNGNNDEWICEEGQHGPPQLGASSITLYAS